MEKCELEKSAEGRTTVQTQNHRSVLLFLTLLSCCVQIKEWLVAPRPPVSSGPVTQTLTELQSSENVSCHAPTLDPDSFVHSGDLDSAVDLLESVCTSPDSNPRLYTAFQRILDVGDDKALDKLSVLTERLANHFSCYRPITDLFVLLLDQGRVDEATFMLNRCPALAEQKDWMFSNITSKALNRGKPTTILHLLNLIPDFTDEEKEKLFTYLMKYHVLEKDLSSAKSVFEQMKAEKVTVNELTLKRLASLYTEAGETPPFTEPPMSYRFYADKLKDKSSSIVELTTEE